MFFERKTKSKNILGQLAGDLLQPLCTVRARACLLRPGQPVLDSNHLSIHDLPENPQQRVFGINLVLFTAPPAIADKRNIGLLPLFMVIMYVLMLTVGFLAINRKLRWRGEEVFELAALPIEDIKDSFSARPRPAGKVPVSKTEMIRFVDFITKNLIAFAFREENRVVFVLTLPGNDLPYLLGTKKDYLNDTWVAIDYDGNITVNITEEDYLLFKMDLDFDQICQSLGDLFSEFLELSKQGQESRIIDRMNSLRLFPLN